jgi:formamidopyrimidine-DNA glycosylase
MLAKLGPEPVSPGIGGGQLAARFKGRKTPIKAALLDQTVIAGIGNIYACEALHQAGLSPRRQARTVQGGRADRLSAAIRDVLERAIAAGGSSLRDHRLPSGELGYFQHSFTVYGRENEPCPRCHSGQTIRRIVQAGRSTFYCSGCQR